MLFQSVGKLGELNACLPVVCIGERGTTTERRVVVVCGLCAIMPACLLCCTTKAVGIITDGTDDENESETSDMRDEVDIALVGLFNLGLDLVRSAR